MNIRLSKEHGLNPTVPLCFYCQQPKNEIILMGANGGREAPKNAVFDKVPCGTCKDYMRQGVILISVRDGEESKAKDNPYRTGGWWVLKQEACESVFGGIDFNKQRVMFIPDAVAEKVGLTKVPKTEPQTEG